MHYQLGQVQVRVTLWPPPPPSHISQYLAYVMGSELKPRSEHFFELKFYLTKNASRGDYSIVFKFVSL